MTTRNSLPFGITFFLNYIWYKAGFGNLLYSSLQVSGCYQDDRSVYFRIRVKFGIESSDSMTNKNFWSEYSVLFGQIEPRRRRKLFVEVWPSIGTHIGIEHMLSTRCDWPSGIKKNKNKVRPAAFSVKKYYQISVELLRGRSLGSGRDSQEITILNSFHALLGPGAWT